MICDNLSERVECKTESQFSDNEEDAFSRIAIKVDKRHAARRTTGSTNKDAHAVSAVKASNRAHLLADALPLRHR